MAADDVFIRNSGSTNTAGYAIVIHKNFIAEFAGQQKMVGEAQAKWLFAKLAEAKPFAQLGGMHCMKSASFGSFTTITYQGETTPDLSCPGGTQSRELERTIGIIVNQLGINTRPGIPLDAHVTSAARNEKSPGKCRGFLFSDIPFSSRPESRP